MPARVDVVAGLLVLEQPVDDFFEALEHAVGALLRREYIGVRAVEAIYEVDELEVADPLVRVHEVEVGAADEVVRLVVAVEISADVADAVEREFGAALLRGRLLG